MRGRTLALGVATLAVVGCSFPDYVASEGAEDVGGVGAPTPGFDATTVEASDGDAGSKHDVNPEAFVLPDGACIFPNDCGGCLPLGHSPDEACGGCGKYVCSVDGNDIECVDPGKNACGGCASLANAPGDTCGDCGKWVCATDGESIACDDPGLNACGGCATLVNKPGDACAGCSGTYVCNGTLLQCNSGVSNACGGCTTLANAVGTTCGVCGSGKYACNGPDATTCDDPVTTPAPGTACGTCKTLKYACAANGLSTACPTPDDANACGGCGKLPGDPGDDCGVCGFYICTTAHTLVCRSPPKCYLQ